MTRRTVSTTAAGLALGAALSLLGGAGTAGAAPSGTSAVETNVQANSNLRSDPSTRATLAGTTTEVTRAFIECYSRGERVTAGGYTTDVWYRGVFGGYELIVLWAWGGNVNVGADPAPGIPVC